MDNQEYCDEETRIRIKELCKQHKSPFVIINLEKVINQYVNIKNGFKDADIFYAVKSNPADEVISKLNELGSCFDAASIYEIDQIMRLGVTPNRISYGNTIKKAVDIKYAYEKGIRIYATDSMNDLEKIAANAPQSKIIVRVFVDGSNTAEWPLTKKFGCTNEEAIEILSKANRLGLKPYGISFHVGSQQHDIEVWNHAIKKTKYIFDELAKENIKLEVINMGGGFPAQYIDKIKSIDEYAIKIMGYLKESFKDNMPKVMLEPGRYMVGNSGVIVTEIVLIKPDIKEKNCRWLFCDAGKFNGFIETLGESIKYPIYCDKTGEVGPVILAGPTCDSTDVMYENYKYQLPLSLKEGDLLYFFGTGAYTSSYCAVGFNGFPPLKTIVINSRELTRV
jgi:ornithine decarboxylase